MKYTSFANHWTFLIFCMIVTGGCAKLTKVDPPDNTIVGEDAFNNYANANRAIMGVFRKMGGMSNVVCGGLSIFGDLYSGNAKLLDNDPEYQNFVSGLINPSNNTFRNIFWVRTYGVIGRINACMEGLSKSKGLTATTRDQLIAECRFARALMYINMTGIFGAVPYITSVSDYEHTQFQARDRVDMIDSSCLGDLLNAKKVLYEQAEQVAYRVRPDRFCAMALLARYYLLKNEWQRSATEATTIINSGKYQLESLDNVFLAGSKEVIFQLLPQHESNYAMEAMLIYPNNSKYPKIALSDSLLNCFTSGDGRRSHWIKEVMIDNHVHYCAYKYKKRFQHAVEALPSELTTVIRLAEIFLIRAECRLNMGDLSGALADLNVVHTRAGLEPLQADMSYEKIKSLIERERLLELFTECGHSWTDLVRSGKVDVVMQPIKMNWDPRRRFWPIPQADLDANEYLIQNPGY